MRELATEEFTTLEPAILIKLYDWRLDPGPDVQRNGHGFRSGVTPEELYASARAWWVLSVKRASRYRYAVAVHRGVTRAAWEIDPGSWRSPHQPDEGVRWAFAGSPAPPHIQDAFVGRLGRRVPRLRPDGRVLRLLARVNPAT